MTESTKNLYDTFDPKAYLQQFYSGDVLPEDEAVNLGALTDWLGRTNRVYETALEFGCGPTIHHALPLGDANCVQALTLADYSVMNRAEVQRWINGDETAHNWDAYIRGYLELTGRQCDAEQVKQCAQAVRRLIRSVVPCDVLHDPCLESNETFDLVTSFYTVECATGSRDLWRTAIQRLLGLVKPGGSLFMTVMRNCSWYDVLGRRFPVASVNEDDIATVLPRFGFELKTAEIESVRVHGWEEEGFDSIVLVRAHRTAVT